MKSIKKLTNEYASNLNTLFDDIFKSCLVVDGKDIKEYEDLEFF